MQVCETLPECNLFFFFFFFFCLKVCNLMHGCRFQLYEQCHGLTEEQILLSVFSTLMDQVKNEPSYVTNLNFFPPSSRFGA